MDIRPAKKPTTRTLTQNVSTSASRQQVASRNTHKRSFFRFNRKALIRYGIVSVNLLIVGMAIFMVVTQSNGNAANYGDATNSRNDATNPLDRLSAADIAVNVARMTNLPEVTAVTNYADTINAEIEFFTLDRELVRMPQIMSADIKTIADIREYITQPGDTASGLATQFGVTSDSIKWSNDLLNDALDPGTKILIPPMNGIIYTVRSGDTAEKIAQTYKVSAQQVIIFNDAELNGFQPGQRIFIPNGQKPAPVFNFFVRYGNNGYDPGWCTYYAAAKGGAPQGWGHARTWAQGASRTPGWMVSKIPVPGAIAQTTGIAGDRVGGSWGHVGVVEDVKQENGQYYIKYSDMNGIAGFNRVGNSGWIPALDKYQNFIYRIQ